MRIYSTRKTRILASLVAMIGAAVVFLWPRQAPAWTARSDNDAIYASVFHRMMTRRERLYTGLSVDDHDPDAVVQRQFAKNRGVVPQSRIQAGANGFQEKTTHASAEIFALDSKTLKRYGPWNASIDALAHGSYSDGYLGTYFLRRKGHSWVVLRYRDSGISI